MEKLKSGTDAIASIVPKYSGTVIDNEQEFVQVILLPLQSFTSQMENLLQGFVDANVMDCKVIVNYC